jgi:hypothetical protein
MAAKKRKKIRSFTDLTIERDEGVMQSKKIIETKKTASIANVSKLFLTLSFIAQSILLIINRPF